MIKEENIIKKTISEFLGIDPKELKNEVHLEKDLNLQKMEIFDSLLRLEKHFNIKIHDEEKKKVKTVQDMIDIILDNLS